jgi:DNA-binding XRE family transcriptional regulator
MATLTKLSPLTVRRVEAGRPARISTVRKLKKAGFPVDDITLATQSNHKPSDHPLRDIRVKRYLTQAQLAFKAKVALRTIHAIEARAVVPRYNVRRAILQALRIPFDQHEAIFGPRGGDEE